MQQLPLNNRNFVQLATLAPGVSSDLPDEVGVGLTSTVSISVNGSRRNAVNWLVDGVSNVDVGSNITLLSTPTLESIQEFKIITSSYAAEWPRSGGGVVNVVTKSGTNTFSGSGYEFFRDDALNANSWFRNQSTNPTTQKPPSLKYNNFGYTVGGPVKKDKAFFFWSQEWRRIKRAPSSLTALVPNPDWLNDPNNRQLRRAGAARPQRGEAACRVSGTEPCTDLRQRTVAVRCGCPKHQQHAAGSHPRRLRPHFDVAPDGPVHARPERDAGSWAGCSSALPSPTWRLPTPPCRDRSSRSA